MTASAPERSERIAPTIIPQAAPGLRVARHRVAIDAAIARVIGSTRYILASEVEAFEEEFARFLGVPHVIGVNSGTDALSIGLLALGVRSGDEVIVPALTAVATAVAVQRIGAIVRIVDVDPLTRGIDPRLLDQAISSRTAAVIAVHLHGIPARLTEISRIAKARGIVLIEDCAHAHGATVDGRMAGTFSDAAAFSFYPTKNLGALGDGGAVVVHTPECAVRARRARVYGQDNGGLSVQDGMNSRLDEIQGAVLRALLPHLAADNAMRRKAADRYEAALAPEVIAGRLQLPQRVTGAVWHQYAIEIARRDRVREALRERGVETGIHYAPGLHRHPAVIRGQPPPTCPVADRLADTLLSLPIQPELMAHQPRILTALFEALAAVCEHIP
jgi:dTDP-3-amino-3,4,6-trideoxy-alpha-D-glucose transaminase